MKKILLNLKIYSIYIVRPERQKTAKKFRLAIGVSPILYISISCFIISLIDRV